MIVIPNNIQIEPELMSEVQRLATEDMLRVIDARVIVLTDRGNNILHPQVRPVQEQIQNLIGLIAALGEKLDGT